MKKIISIFWLFSIILFIGFSSSSFATIGKGSALIFNENIGSAKKQALNNALRNAVEKGVGTLIDSKTVTKNWVVIRDEVFSSARGFIKGYIITRDEKSTDGKSWETHIDAQVATASIKNKLENLRILHKKMGHKRLIVVYRPINKKALSSTHNAVLASLQKIQAEYLKSGFRIFNSQVTQQIKNLPSHPTIQQVKQIANSANAELLVEVEVVVGSRRRNSTTYFSIAKTFVRMSVYDVNTGRQISNIQTFKKAFTSARPSSYDWEKALAKAGEKAGQSATNESIKNIIEYYKTVGDIGNAYLLTFLNFSEDEEDTILKELENMEGYQSLKELKNTASLLEIEYFSGLGKGRVRRLIRSKSKSKKIWMQTIDSKGNQLKFLKYGTQLPK
ncbi:MAG: hypothetical protein ACI86H_000760 [bacterium]|jgi:hypothetical protein